VLDLKAIRREPEPVRAALARRNDGSAERLDQVLELDTAWRAATTEAETLRAEQKAASKGGGGADVERLKAMAGEAKAAVARAKEAEDALNALLVSLPNPPAESAADEDTPIRTVGDATAEGADHLELAGRWIDMEAGARVAGSRFAYLTGDLVMLELALVRWGLEVLRGHGFEPVIPPVLVREEALFGTGFLPDTEHQIYRLADDDLYLAGTSEVPLASLHAGEILDDVPRRYAGFSPCFRREAGAAGRDTRGIFRVHQFDKVEMFSFVAPEEAEAEHERLLSIEEELLQALGIPYRVVNIAVTDLGNSATKKYDCEAWLPGQGRFRELTSTSNTTDFQARRLDIRHRGPDGAPRHVHTLNGTAIAVGRTIIAVVENGQQADGTVAIPEVLWQWGAPRVLGQA
jgi:seryl-tRNA synthetase